MCDNCAKPIVLMVEAVKPTSEFQRFFDFYRHATSIEKSGWRVTDSWPKIEYEECYLPAAVPESIRQHFQQSQTAAKNGGYDLAIQGFQRVLLMTKWQYSPEFKGTLTAWILMLITNRHLLANVKDWLNHVPLQNQKIGATALEAEELAVFVASVLDQLYGVNSQIRRYRARGAKLAAA